MTDMTRAFENIGNRKIILRGAKIRAKKTYPAYKCYKTGNGTCFAFNGMAKPFTIPDLLPFLADGNEGVSSFKSVCPNYFEYGFGLSLVVPFY